MFRGVYRGKHAHEDDWKLVLDRARKAGVEKLIITGGNLEESQEAVNLIKEHNEGSGELTVIDCLDNMLFSTVGCHPTRCKEFEDHLGGPADYLDKLLKIVTENKSTVSTFALVFIHDSTEDYDRLHFCPKETQKKYFELQFDLAERTKLPMFLHNRNTGEDFYTMIKANRHRFSQGVVHSFTGSIEEMRKLVDLDLYIGVNGCSMKTEENLQMIKEIPKDRLMIETDAPWCEIRPTHASHKHLSKVSKEEMDLYAPLSKKKEKFEMGYMVKSRCEPCATGFV
ncbi:hypothetical protein BX666DRAFT_2017491 [Dichotomocladium elegans]|nr:hypothetical protein BX666DRAFT_2017491 [Dichotomocladium elegans]